MRAFFVLSITAAVGKKLYWKKRCRFFSLFGVFHLVQLDNSQAALIYACSFCGLRKKKLNKKRRPNFFAFDFGRIEGKKTQQCKIRSLSVNSDLIMWKNVALSTAHCAFVWWTIRRANLGAAVQWHFGFIGILIFFQQFWFFFSLFSLVFFCFDFFLHPFC